MCLIVLEHPGQGPINYVMTAVVGVVGSFK